MDFVPEKIIPVHALDFPHPVTLPDYRIYFRQLKRRYGWRAWIKQFRSQFRRDFSRRIVRKYAPEGIGVEVGVGAFTIAPVARTVLSDAHSSHAGDSSIATHFFSANQLPFAPGALSFVLSEHVLEHLGDPIGAIRNWMAALRPGGVIFLFLPYRDRTFDRERDRTPLSHLIEDENRRTPDSDRTHLEEWSRKVIQKGYAPHYSKTPLEKHPECGLVHHHVWITEDIRELARYLGLDVLEAQDFCPDRTDSFVVVLRKPA